MNWIVLAIFAYMALALEKGLDLLLVWKEASPSFVLILAMFVALSASPRAVPWAMLVLGLLQDLTHPYDIGVPSSMSLIGPYCLGYLTGGYVCTQLHTVVIRDSPLALAVLVFAAGVFVHLVTVVLITARQMPGLHLLHVEPVLAWRAADELVRRFFELIYTTTMALPVGYVLFRTDPLWRFTTAKWGVSRARHMV